MEFLINTSEQHELFGDFLPPAYAAEAARRWGRTAEWSVAAERVLEYSLTEWQEIRGLQEDLEVRLVRLVTGGEPADGKAATGLAEEQRRQIDRWFYPCPHAQHVRIAEFILADPSFRARYEGLARGTAQYLRDAVVANAALHAGE